MRIRVWVCTLVVSTALAICKLPLSGQTSLGAKAHSSAKQDWTNYVRIGAYGLTADNADKIVASAEEDGVSGIEVDNDIEGRYESFLDPKAKLEAIRAVAEKAHAAGNHAYVYIAGTECITANADQTPHTLAKDHPDWLQRKITGEPAIFGGGTAFWIAKGDEDVWVTPYAPEWRKRYMERVRQIAATGIDGIYVDIPYWMTHFKGWEDTWASFDDYTVTAFKKQTGLDGKKDVKLGDFSDPNFRRWVDFRIQTITDFMQEIDQNAKSVNPKIKTIPEIYPGIEEAVVRVGADVYSLYPVVDAIAHEYSFSGGGHRAAAPATGLVPLPGWPIHIPSLRSRKSELDPELFLGWRKECGPARSHEEPGNVGDLSGNKLLGRAGALDGWIQRSSDAQGNLLLDQATRQSFLSAAGADRPGRGVFFPKNAQFLCG